MRLRVAVEIIIESDFVAILESQTDRHRHTLTANAAATDALLKFSRLLSVRILYVYAALLMQRDCKCKTVCFST